MSSERWRRKERKLEKIVEKRMMSKKTNLRKLFALMLKIFQR